MLMITDLNAEFAKLNMLRGRTPETTAAEREEKSALLRLAPYRDGAIFIAKFAGGGVWERHPNGDEIVQIIDGTTTLYVDQRGSFRGFHPERRRIRCHSPRGMASVRVGRGCELNYCDPQPSEFSHLGRSLSPRTLNSVILRCSAVHRKLGERFGSERRRS